MKIKLNETELDLGEGKLVLLKQEPVYSEGDKTLLHTLFKIVFKSEEAS